MMHEWQEGGFGLYLHWPFCAAKCPYCDFNSHVAAEIDHDRWREAYLREIARVAAQTPGRVLHSVFFGGGTPSLMNPDVVADLIEAARRAWTPANAVEVTLEANPTSSESGRFRAFAAAGVNRLSMGIQALNDPDLKRLGRLHTAAEAQAAFAIARESFERVSFDLIYARQDQTVSDWQAELRRALDMTVDHLSLYQLTIEDGTAFGARAARGLLRGLPDEDLSADLYQATQDICEAAGMPAYEISNHARPGAQSRHNLIYWRGGDFVGIGPGAHGRLTLESGRVATESYRAPGQWLSAVESGGNGESLREILPPEDQATEYLMMSLRLAEGADLRRHAALGGHLNPNSINMLVDDGLLVRADDILSATACGRPLLNAVLRALLLDSA